LHKPPHFFPDSDDLYGVVARLIGALPPGSYVALQHGTEDFLTPEVSNKLSGAVNNSGVPFVYRTRDEFARFFAGLDLVPPGIQPIAEWRAENEPRPRPAPEEASSYGAVARKDRL
jgi:S-adenosyl methyltransferase